MLPKGVWIGAAALICIASCQVSSVPYCDPLTEICYTSYTTRLGISFRIALPNADGPIDAILQIVAPVTIGWAGFAWGGTMPWNPLSIGWSNATGAVVSSRLGSIYHCLIPRQSIHIYVVSLPILPIVRLPILDLPPYRSSKALSWSFRSLQKLDKIERVIAADSWAFRDRDRSMLRLYLSNQAFSLFRLLNFAVLGAPEEWKDSDGSNVMVPLNGTTTFAYAYAIAPPLEPADNTSTFNFNSWVVNSLILAPTTSQPSSTDTKSSTPTSLLPTSATPSSNTALTATAVATGIPTVCPGIVAPKYPSVVANGWKATKVKGGMAAARGVVFDSAGHLLVVESGKGITAHTLDASGCVQSSKTIVSQLNLNHGITFDANKTTLYASSMTVVWSWTYDPAAVAVVGTAKTVIKGMYNSGHPTRSLLMSPSNPNTLLVSHGASGNIDYPSTDIATGRAMTRVFDLGAIQSGGYNYSTGGFLLAYGLRNAVGIVFDRSNKLWATENSSSELTRTDADGTTFDIHGDNPAEELNYIGDIAPSTKWFGFPTCYSVWKPADIRDRAFSVGDQFVLAPNTTFSDSSCSNVSIPPRLTFQAHSAPLDTKFDASFANMYIAFHGSWDRDPPTGYKVVEVPFFRGRDGSYPAAQSNSTSGYRDIWWNANATQCSATNCSRPAGIVFDPLGRMYVTSDASGEGEMWLSGKI
ncbi:uncharacterized protein PAC_12357 [Phialocephala subalpina]|uniref:Uncharacterized protein n=1 Tax=Phialocephala subalpina TaxID=576137 RepID=A0A1L7XBN0_9HELO|nr:uncharacterized protein PAC_12357 [Phialocephala subalpina]